MWELAQDSGIGMPTAGRIDIINPTNYRRRAWTRKIRKKQVLQSPQIVAAVLEEVFLGQPFPEIISTCDL